MESTRTTFPFSQLVISWFKNVSTCTLSQPHPEKIFYDLKKKTIIYSTLQRIRDKVWLFSNWDFRCYWLLNTMNPHSVEAFCYMLLFIYFPSRRYLKKEGCKAKFQSRKKIYLSCFSSSPLQLLLQIIFYLIYEIWNDNKSVQLLRRIFFLILQVLSLWLCYFQNIRNNKSWW